MIRLKPVRLLCLVALCLTTAIVSAQDRRPIERFENGFPMELGIKARSASLPDLLAGGDEASVAGRGGAPVHTRLSGFSTSSSSFRLFGSSKFYPIGPHAW